MNLIEDHEVALILMKEECWIGKLVPVLSGLEIEVESARDGIGDAPCQRRLSYLARPDDSHHAVLGG